MPKGKVSFEEKAVSQEGATTCSLEGAVYLRLKELQIYKSSQYSRDQPSPELLWQTALELNGLQT